MSLRIISGHKKGFKLNVPTSSNIGDKEFQTRPMTDRAKSALFSKIGDKIINAKVLDLYAGSGASGIESLSRGAKYVTFVDLSTEAIETIKQNLRKTGYTNKATIVKQDANKFLKKTLKEENVTFDIIFITPPWSIVGTHAIKQSGGLITENGIVISEHTMDYELPDDVGELTKVDERQYGKTILTYFRIPNQSNN